MGSAARRPRRRTEERCTAGVFGACAGDFAVWREFDEFTALLPADEIHPAPTRGSATDPERTTLTPP